MRRLHTIDWFRGIAALAVMLYHTRSVWPAAPGRGYLAVDLFFMLSGYVLASSYDERLRAGTLSATGFLRRRFNRLYPEYLGSVLLIAAIAAFTGIYGKAYPLTPTAHVGRALALMVFLIPSAVAGSGYLFALNPPYWSLWLEAIINAVYAWVPGLFSRRSLGVLVAGSGVLLLAIAVHRGNLNIGAVWGLNEVLGGFARVSFGFGVGVLLFHLRGRWHDPRWNRVLGLLALAVVPSYLLLCGSLGTSAVWDLLGIGLVFPLGVLAATRIELTGLWARVAGGLGFVSYPLYVIQQPLFDLLVSRYPGLRAQPSVLHGLACGGAIVLAAWGFGKACDALRPR